MAKKALKKTANVLGGLGAAYMLTDLLGPRVKADPVEAARDVLATHERVQRERVDKRPAPEPVQSRIRLRDPNEHHVPEDTSGSRIRPLPLFGLEEFEVRKKKGGAVKAKPKKMASGGMASASKRADGIATKGKTKCKMY